MYTVTKRLEICGAHSLVLPYQSKCQNLHGHNWIITVTCRAKELDENGMVVDFEEIKRVVMQLDHANINHIFERPYKNNPAPNRETNPTAENIARWICERVPNCVKVEVRESEGNIAVYERDPE